MWGYLFQHISSRRHKDRVAGKPMKPKYSPYNKLQRSPSILAVSIFISPYYVNLWPWGLPPHRGRDSTDLKLAQGEAAQGSDLRIVRYSVSPIKGTQTALRVLFTARKKGIISGMGNEPRAPWKGISSAGLAHFLEAAIYILSLSGHLR